MRQILVVCLLFTASHSHSQFNSKAGHIMFKYGMGKVDSARYSIFSVAGEWLVHKNIGLNYDLEFVHRNDHIYQIHTSAGVLVGPPILGLGIIGLLTNNNYNNSSFNIGSLGILLGILAFVMPDGISFHIPYKYNWDFSPYVNVLGVDYMKNNNIPKGYYRYSSSLGMKATYWQENNFTLTTFFETRKVAGMGWGFGGGMGLGFTF